MRVKTRATVFMLAATPGLLVTVSLAITSSIIRNSQLVTETMCMDVHSISTEAGGGPTAANLKSTSMTIRSKKF